MIAAMVFVLVAYMVAGFFILTIGLRTPVISSNMFKNWLLWPFSLWRELRDW